MSGTLPFPRHLWLPPLEGFRLSLWALMIGLAGIVLVSLMLRGTHFGLRLKAVGGNPRGAYLLGVHSQRTMMLSFALCGAFAGTAGAVQITAVYHSLIPSISSGYGFLGLLVAMLVNHDPLWVAPVAFFFAALNIGSIQLPMELQIDSSLSGVLQGSLVLSVLIAHGIRQRMTHPALTGNKPKS